MLSHYNSSAWEILFEFTLDSRQSTHRHTRRSQDTMSSWPDRSPRTESSSSVFSVQTFSGRCSVVVIQCLKPLSNWTCRFLASLGGKLKPGDQSLLHREPFHCGFGADSLRGDGDRKADSPFFLSYVLALCYSVSLFTLLLSFVEWFCLLQFFDQRPARWVGNVSTFIK